jgi:hypothetical protein
LHKYAEVKEKVEVATNLGSFKLAGVDEPRSMEDVPP